MIPIIEGLGALAMAFFGIPLSGLLDLWSVATLGSILVDRDSSIGMRTMFGLGTVLVFIASTAMLKGMISVMGIWLAA